MFNYSFQTGYWSAIEGALDGLAYWPDTETNFFKEISSTFEQEIARYDVVIFSNQWLSMGMISEVIIR